ncbi:hypothetical protein [Streptomyces sp. NBC_00005]|uniref:hypothetical protein n=1 Tax=Streptomyces sp. NBC_00005 TaxID=2903609 RepID=UPI00324E595F
MTRQCTTHLQARENCLTCTATQAIVAGLGARALGIRVHPGAATALALSLGTHYIADRRVPGKDVLEKLANKTGKANFYKLADFGMNGLFMVMRYLKGDPEAPPSRIAAATGLQRTNLSTILRS